jgi:hypothetical protein
LEGCCTIAAAAAATLAAEEVVVLPPLLKVRLRVLMGPLFPSAEGRVEEWVLPVIVAHS